MPTTRTTVDRDGLAAPTLEAARSLIGAYLVRDPDREDGNAAAQPRVGRIVEVEAYIGQDDRASHARFGRTGRNAVMFGPPGIAYVYLVYGMYDCLNVVTEPEGRPAAVLIRAIEPVDGADEMRRARSILLTARRRRPVPPPADGPRERIASGPGLVAAAFGITRADTGVDLCDPRSHLRLERPPPIDPVPDVHTTARVGVAYAGEPWASLPWRFVEAGNRSVSGPVGSRDG